MKNNKNIQQVLPYEYEAKRFYKLKNKDFNKLIKNWIQDGD